MTFAKFNTLTGLFIAGAAALGSHQAAAATLYQSVADLTAAPAVNAWCSDCGGMYGEDMGQQFTLTHSSLAQSLTFVVSNSPAYAWQVPVTISIFHDAGGSTGASVFSQTYAPSQFVSDANTGNGTDIVSVNLGSGVNMAAGNFVVFLYNVDTLGIPGFNGGSGQGVFTFGVSGGVTTGTAYSPINAFPVGHDLGVELTGTISPVPVPAALPLLGASLIGLGGLGWWRQRKAA